MKDPTLWILSLVITAAIVVLMAVLLWANPAKSETPSTGMAFCSLYAREATRIDLMHTIPVKPENVSDSYIKALATRLYMECVSVIPALLPLPEHTVAWTLGSPICGTC